MRAILKIFYKKFKKLIFPQQSLLCINDTTEHARHSSKSGKKNILIGRQDR